MVILIIALLLCVTFLLITKAALLIQALIILTYSASRGNDFQVIEIIYPGCQKRFPDYQIRNKYYPVILYTKLRIIMAVTIPKIIFPLQPNKNYEEYFYKKN